MSNPINNPEAVSLSDEEILEILRRVESGELNVEEAERLLSGAAGQPEEPEPARADPDSQEFSAPLGKSANGKLIFERGGAGLTVRGESLPGQLFAARFQQHVPVVRVNGGTVTVRYRDTGFGLLNWLRYGFKSPRGQINLHTGIPWQIEMRGGIAQSHLDLGSINLQRFSINGGATDIDLRLGEPRGEIRVDLSSGLNNFKILRPESVPVRLTIRGGAANLMLDNQKFGAIGGTTSLETPHSQQAGSRYLITINGGANNFKVDTL
jgi:hypothetical protein